MSPMPAREINLLDPKIIRIRAERIYLERLGHLIRWCIFLGVLALGALGGAYGVVWWTGRVLSSGTTTAEDRTQTVISEVRKVNGQLIAITEWIKANPPWTPLLPEVVTALPNGVVLTSVSVAEETDALTVRGVADTRESLVLWQRKLEALPWVEQVKAPLSNLATGSEAQFSLEISRKAETKP